MLQHTDETAAGGRSLADQAFLRLQDRLILLDIPPGSPLNEARLSEDSSRLSASRSGVRPTPRSSQIGRASCRERV